MRPVLMVRGTVEIVDDTHKGEFTKLLIVIPLVSRKHINFSCVAVDERWCDLCIVLVGRCTVEIEDSINSRID